MIASTMLVWVLMVATESGSGMVSYSPPVASNEDCQRMYRVIKHTWIRERATCVQINMVFPSTPTPSE